MKENLFSFFSMQNEECCQNAALLLAKTYARKLKRRTVYIPVGLVFQDMGTISLTELFFQFRKGRELQLPKEELLTVIRPFNCVMEFGEIEEETYICFLKAIASQFEVAILQLGQLPPSFLLRFMSSSICTAVTLDARLENYGAGLESLLRNLKLYWKDEFESKISRFLFLIWKGTEIHKNIIMDLLVREIAAEGKVQNAVYLLEGSGKPPIIRSGGFSEQILSRIRGMKDRPED